MVTLNDNTVNMRFTSWFILLNSIFCKTYGQHFPNIQFTHLTQKEGLSNDGVRCIAQDHEGFIWIGTNDGLNRFDGYHVQRIYQIPGEKNSLVNNTIHNLAFDKNDRLWISTREGFSCYDRRTGVFRNFRHNPADTNSLETDQDIGLYIDHDNSAWVATSTALYHYDSLFHYKKVTMGFKQMVLDQKMIGAYGYLMEDRQNQLWSAKYGYLFLVDKKTKLVKKQYGPLKGIIRCIYQDSHLHYWVGSFLGGLCGFDPATGTFDNIPLNNSSSVVYSVTEWKDQNNFTWIVAGTDAGIVLIDPVTLENKAYNYRPGSQQQNYLSGTTIGCVFVDRQNTLWIASDGGVSYVQPSRQYFESWSIFGSNDTSGQFIFDYPYALAENKDGIFVSTWLRSGLLFFNKSGEIRNKISFYHQHELTLPNDQYPLKQYDVRWDGSNALWFSASYSLVNLDLASGKKTVYEIPDKKDDIGLRTILSLDEHHWWIRTRNNGGNGVYIFDPVARKFTRHYEYNPDCKGCAPGFITDMLITNKKEIYLASGMDGLFRYDKNTDQFVSLLKFADEELLSHSNDFESLAQDRNGLIWIGTFKGLIAYNPALHKLERDYSSDHSIGGVEITAICFDEEGNLWMNTQRGIFCVIMATGEIRNFSHWDGLPNDVTEGLLKMGGDHFMYCGIRDYLVRFRPDRLLKKQEYSSNAIFSEASVMDKPYFFKRSKSGEKSIEIGPGENRISLDFAVLNYDVPDRNHYYYRLDGAMKNWQENENGHLAFYNLTPGNYTLHVSGDKRPGGNEDLVRILVKPGWWQTVWFESAVVGVIGLLTIILIRRRISNIRKEAGIKQKLAETEMMALRTQMNPHFIFNSLNSIENFIMQNQKRQASDYLNKFARLIRMILESSRDDLVTVAKDMEALQLYIDLEQLRFNQKFQYEADIDEELLDDDYRIPPMLIQPFVENAIVHGLANSEKPGLRLKVTAKLDGEYIRYTVEDNGVGRKQAAVYHAQNRPNHKSVGMRITEERINSFSKQQGSKGDVKMVDLFDDLGEPAGTVAQIRIKSV